MANHIDKKPHYQNANLDQFKKKKNWVQFKCKKVKRNYYLSICLYVFGVTEVNGQ